VRFYVLNEETVCTGDRLMCRWFMRTENAVERGARFELTKHGMMLATFSALNRLTSTEMTYDVMAFMQQLRRASNVADFSVVPNSMQLALEPVNDARIVASSMAPFTVSYASKVGTTAVWLL
jgi:hypothetical protein